ncbi:MAG: MCE family protein [Solirubrobacteraceae bacterium]|nr:MCE family protein [Solirubrobacteraceae bacterium]
MTPARGVALGALIVGLVVVAVVVFTGGGGPTYKFIFENSGQLVTGNEVQISGRPVGKVTDIQLNEQSQAEVTVQLTDSSLEELPSGTKATVRQASLSSVAGRFISLQLGTGPGLDDGSTIPSTQTTSTVDLDQLFATLDEPTRKALSKVIQGQATWYQGRGAEANEAAKYFAPALSSTSKLLRELTRDQGTFESLIVNASKVVGAVAQKRNDLSALVSNANETSEAIASQSTALDESLQELPTTLRRGNSTFVNLRATLNDLEPLVDVSLEQTKDLAPFLKELQPLLEEAKPTVADLSEIVRKSGPNNDLTDLMAQAPKITNAATPAFANTKKAIDKSLPFLSFARPYSPELIGALRDFGQSNAYYDANGHFARVSAMTNAFSYDPSTNVLTPQDPSQRASGFSFGNVRRCPGGVSQPTADGSGPYTENGTLDCDATKVLPGP